METKLGRQELGYQDTINRLKGQDPSYVVLNFMTRQIGIIPRGGRGFK